MASTVTAINALVESKPPASDYMTYLTIIESHISPAILPTLHDILQDAILTQNIGWDLIQLLLPLPGSEDCLTTIARLGNPREVVLKVTEALQLLDWDEEEDDEGEEGRATPNAAQRYCLLAQLLGILLPRIKTKYPSRFLSTSLIALLANFHPSTEATVAVITFVQIISGKKRPPLPGRKSSTNILQRTVSVKETAAPDPEAQETADPSEAAITQKLLQSFVTHILEEYVSSNTLEWATRLQEHYNPGRVVSNKQIGKLGMSEAFKENGELESRDTVVGQLVTLARDLNLSNYDVLFDSIYNSESSTPEDQSEEEHPNSPTDIPLSKRGCLMLLAAYIFSSVLFGSNISPPELFIFPNHAQLVQHFLNVSESPASAGETESVTDAILMIGLWLEENNKFVGGPLEDEDFLQLLQALSLLSANNPSPTLRDAAHNLTSSILHAHPSDQVRLAFIADTLEHCPFENLKGSAVSWLKDEIITAYERKSDNSFSSTVSLAATQPYLFPDTSSIANATATELLEELSESYPFHIAVVNFILFLAGNKYGHVVASSMFTIVEEVYLGPLKLAVERGVGILTQDSNPDQEGQEVELALLADRIALSSKLISEK